MTYKRVGTKRLAFCFSYFMLTAVSADVVTEDDLLADMHLVSSVTHMNQTLDKTNAFFDKDWKAYKETMSKVETKTFQDIKTFSKINP